MDFGKYRKDKNLKAIWMHRAFLAGIMLSLVIFIVQSFCLLNEYEKKKGTEVLQQFSDYYEFEPNSVFAGEALKRYNAAATSVMLENEAKVYTEYLTKWAAEPDVDILRTQLYGFYGKQDVRVYSYINQKSYDIAWEDFILPLSEGRWFEGNREEVICVQGSSYEIGDLIKMEDGDGNSFEAVVVGKTNYPYLPHNTMPISSGVQCALYKPADDVEAFLLNPLSEYNTKSDSITYTATLILTDNESFISKNSQYGTFTPVEYSLVKDEVNYAMPIITMIVSLILFVLVFVLALFVNEHKGILWSVWLAGITAYIVGSLLYIEISYKFRIMVLVCTIVSLIYLLCRKKGEKDTVDDIEVVVLQKDTEWEKTEI